MYKRQGVGIDLNPKRIEEANANAKAAEVENLVQFRLGNFYKVDFSDATVVALYLPQTINYELRPILWKQLKIGSRVVSNESDMGSESVSYTHLEQSRAFFRSRWREVFEGDPTLSVIYRDIASGIASAGIEYYLPLFFEETATLFHYLPENAIFALIGNTSEAFQRFWADTQLSLIHILKSSATATATSSSNGSYA